MPKKFDAMVPFENTPIPNIPNSLEVDSDKLERPYAKISDDNGNYYEQEKLKNKKVRRTMVSDK